MMMMVPQGLYTTLGRVKMLHCIRKKLRLTSTQMTPEVHIQPDTR